MADLIETKTAMDDNIAERARHHEQRKALEARGELLQAAKLRADTYDTGESSINIEEEIEMDKVGVSVNDARKTFVGLTADTSSDEELIPPTLAAVFEPIDKDLSDPQINPFAGEPSAAASIDPSPRERIPAADPLGLRPRG